MSRTIFPRTRSQQSPYARLTLAAVALCAAFLVLPGCRGDGRNGGDGDGVLSSSSASSTSKGSRKDASVTVFWVAPAQRQDGTPLSLSEIAGYRVLYGEAPGTYTLSLFVEGGSATEAVIPGTPPSGTVYVAVEAIDRDGLASGPSDEVSVAIE